MRKCFACDRKLGRNPILADTRDGQTVFVGSECWKLIKASGEAGYQPSLGGPKLYLIPSGLSQKQLDD
mgnify:CR=1 FL=1